MPRRAEFIFYLNEQETRLVSSNCVSMPRRAEFIFYRWPLWDHCKPLGNCFNAPKGWIHFLSGWLPVTIAGSLLVSMPRRAEFIFYQAGGTNWCTQGYNLCFNAPKGWIHFLSLLLEGELGMVRNQFQCPEGLNSFSIRQLGEVYPLTDWVSMPRRAEFIFYLFGTITFDAETRVFQCPEGLNSFSI